MSHIKNIEIKNFKSIRHAKIEDCRRVNVFIGYPNVGKSNILEAMGLFSFMQFYNGEIFALEDICRFNHLSDLNFEKDIKNEIHIGLNSIYELYFRKGVFKEKRDDFGKEDYVFDLNVYKYDSSIFSMNVYKEIGKAFHGPADKTDVRDDIVDKIKIKYYVFKKEGEYNERKSLSLSIPNGDNFLEILHGNSDLRKGYLELLKEYNLKLNISDKEISIAKELNDGTYVSFNQSMLADTLQRLIFHKAAIATNKNAVLLFEEPEAHMFPPYISKFTGDVMFDENNNQFFITTHSPFVLNDFMEELREEDELAVYIVSYKKETGETMISRMNKEEMHEAAQFGYDFFLNMQNFIPAN